MEFWGIEVKPGETVKCEPGDDKYLHLSQASLGVVKNEKDNENIRIHLKVDDQKLVIGTLSTEKCLQIAYDFVFEKEFELSHSWKNGSVFFAGYKTEILDEEPDQFSEEFYSESEEDIPTLVPANGKPTSKNELAKTIANAEKVAKPSAKIEDSVEGDDSSEDDSDDEDMIDGEDDDSDDDNDEDETSDEEDRPPPKKAETGKKRAAEAALTTPSSNKKAKLAALSSGEKTGRRTATPHPAKQAEKAPAAKGK